MTSKYIETEVQKDIAIVTLNRSAKRNALSPELAAELQAELIRLGESPEVRVVILTGSGTAFCSGADLAYLKELSGFSPEENRKDSQSLAEVFQTVYTLPKLTIAMVNGAALAGGCGLATCCDFIIASKEKARFGFTEVRIGFVPAIVLNFLLRKIPPAVVAQLVLSGDILTAEEALKCGLVNSLFPAKSLRNETLEFAESLLNRNSFEAMMQTKKLFQELLDTPIVQGLDLAIQTNAESRMTSDCQKGLSAFLAKERIDWRD